MRLLPRPPDSPNALEGYLAAVNATISDDVKALESTHSATDPAKC
jgi:hypothetical protein